MLALAAQGRPPGGQHGERRATTLAQRAHEGRDRGQVLDVVQDEQRRSVLQQRRQGVHAVDRAGRPEGPRACSGHAGVGLDLGQVDPQDPVGEPGRRRLRHRQGEGGLPHARRTGQRQEGPRRQQPDRRSQLLIASDELDERGGRWRRTRAVERGGFRRRLGSRLGARARVKRDRRRQAPGRPEEVLAVGVRDSQDGRQVLGQRARRSQVAGLDAPDRADRAVGRRGELALGQVAATPEPPDQLAERLPRDRHARHGLPRPEQQVTSRHTGDPYPGDPVVTRMVTLSALSGGMRGARTVLA